MTVRDFVIRLLLDRTQARQGLADTREDLRDVGVASARAADEARDALGDAARAMSQDGRRAGREVSGAAEDAADALKKEGNAGKEAGDKIADGAKEATARTDQLKDSIGKAIAMAGGIAAVMSYIGDTAALDRTAESLGLNVERLQMWQGAAQAAGGDAEEIADRFRDLNDYIVDATKFDSGPLKDIAKEVGISLTDATGKARSAEEVMLDLSDAFARVGEQEAVGYGMQLSFDPATIGLLQQGRGELEALLNRQRDLGILTKRDTEAATRARQAFVDAIKAATYIMGTTLTPVLELVADKLSGLARWAVEHKDFLKILFVVAAVAITGVMLPALYSMAAAGLAAIAPFLPLIAIVTALGLVIDDLAVFIDGGNSAFEELLRWMGLSEGQIEAVRAAFAQAKGYIGAVVDLFKALFTLDGDGVIAALDKMFGYLREIKNAFGNLFDFIKAKLLNILPDWVRELLGVGGAESAEGQAQGDAGSETQAGTETPGATAMRAAPQAPEIPIAAATPGILGAGMNALNLLGSALTSLASPASQDNRKTVTSTTTVQNVNIQTQATDAQGIAREIPDALGDVMQQEYALS